MTDRRIGMACGAVALALIAAACGSTTNEGANAALKPIASTTAQIMATKGVTLFGDRTADTGAPIKGRGATTDQGSDQPVWEATPPTTGHVAALAAAIGATGAITEYAGGWSTQSRPGTPRLFVLKDAAATWLYGPTVDCDLSRTPNARYICAVTGPSTAQCVTAGAPYKPFPDPTALTPYREGAPGDGRCTNPPASPERPLPGVQASLEARSAAVFEALDDLDPGTTLKAASIGPVIECAAAVRAPLSAAGLEVGYNYAGNARIDDVMNPAETRLAFDACSPETQLYAGVGSLLTWRSVGNYPTLGESAAVSRLNGYPRVDTSTTLHQRCLVEVTKPSWCKYYATASPQIVDARRVLVFETGATQSSLLVPAWQLLVGSIGVDPADAAVVGSDQTVVALPDSLLTAASATTTGAPTR